MRQLPGKGPEGRGGVCRGCEVRGLMCEGCAPAQHLAKWPAVGAAGEETCSAAGRRKMTESRDALVSIVRLSKESYAGLYAVWALSQIGWQGGVVQQYVARDASGDVDAVRWLLKHGAAEQEESPSAAAPTRR